MIHHMATHQSVGMREYVALRLTDVEPERHPQGDELAPIKVQPRIDWGRWIVDCPYCPAAVLLDWGCPMTYCLSCHNEAGGHLWVEVDLPTHEERMAIEAALEGLPESAQHWRPGQSLEGLATGARPAEIPHPEMLAQLAQSAGEERDRLADQVEALQRANTEERQGAWRLVRMIERLRLEADVRKQLNRELQDQIDAFAAHGHEN